MAVFHDETAQQKTQAVLKVVKTYISPGEAEDVLSQMPDELRDLWMEKINVRP